MSQENIIYGIHAVSAALDHHPENILVIFREKGEVNSRLQALITQAEKLGYRLQEVSGAKLEKLTGTKHHQGVAASARAGKTFDEKALFTLVKEKEDSLLLLVLENIQDPHNLGACLRSAEAFGVDAVILPKDNSAPLNATVSKAACGAVETLRIVSVSNLVRCLKQLQEEGVWIMGTSDKAKKSISEVKSSKRLALVMGSEGKGLKRLTLETCDEVVSIPLKGKVNSLNVSVATGICLFHVTRIYTHNKL